MLYSPMSEKDTRRLMGGYFLRFHTLLVLGFWILFFPPQLFSFLFMNENFGPVEFAFLLPFFFFYGVVEFADLLIVL